MFFFCAHAAVYMLKAIGGGLLSCDVLLLPHPNLFDAIPEKYHDWGKRRKKEHLDALLF